jgi:hypothetical protein
MTATTPRTTARPTSRPISRPRLRRATASASLAGAVALAVLTTVAATDRTSAAGVATQASWLVPGLLASAGVGVLVLALALANPGPIVVSLGLLGTAFLIAQPATEPWHSAAPLAGGWLLAVAELAYWSVELRIAGRDAPGIHRRRLGLTVALLAAGMVMAAVPEIRLGETPLTGVELTALGLAGGAALIALAAWLAWRLRPTAPDPAASTRGRRAGG